MNIHSSHGGNPAPSVRLRFTDFDGMAGEGYQLYTQDDTWHFAWLSAMDCTFGGSSLYFAGPDHLGLTNNLFDRVFLQFLSDPAVSFYNNLVRGGDWMTFNLSTNLWAFHDNVFDSLGLADDGTSRQSNNVYVATADRLTPTNGTEIITNTFPWVTGPLGRYYQPEGNPLINSGSRNATNAGLYHYCTTTNQAKEGASTVDRGLHLGRPMTGW